MLLRLTRGACCAEHLGVHMTRPVAALVIFRACLQWKTFQADRTVLFDKVPAPSAALGCTLMHSQYEGCRGQALPQHLGVCLQCDE